MANYKIITDEQKLRKFIDWLPELKPTERYYFCLFARSKYVKNQDGSNQIAHIKSDKAQLKRGVTDKERMYWKIKQLEIESGAYRQKDIAIPQEALALYINTNPRDLYKATANSVVKLAQCLRDQNHLGNPHQEVLSEIQRTKGTTHFVDFDLDFPVEVGDRERYVNEAVIPLIHKYVNVDAVTFLNTRGGLHILVEPKKVNHEFKNKFYQGISSIAGVDQTGDQMIPVPGTHQGGFTPYFITL